jgi:hypothetical protein
VPEGDVIKGDISNDLVQGWMVTLDALTNGSVKMPKKTWRKSWSTVARETPIDVLNLGRLWQTSNKFGLRFECVVFEQPQEYVDALEQHLDRLGAHPITYVTGYVSRKSLLKALPFRPDIAAVVDTRENALYWGGRGLTWGDF